MEHPLYQHVACPLCGAQQTRLKFPATPNWKAQPSFQSFCCTNSYLAYHGDIVECLECGLLYNNQQPTPEALLRMYQQVEDPRYVQEERGRDYTFKKSLRQLHKYSQPPGTLLDVGCYTGVFMAIAAAAGWDVCGVELSDWAADIARANGIGQVYQGQIHDLPLPAHSLNVITMWDVIEHLADPGRVLDQAANLLQPGGVLAFSTYFMDSLPARILGTRYPFLMDMHIVHFSRNTLRRILREHGYELLGILPHDRVITVPYFLEKLAALVPYGKRFFTMLQQQRWLQKRFITIPFSGLANIFARLTISAGSESRPQSGRL